MEKGEDEEEDEVEDEEEEDGEEEEELHWLQYNFTSFVLKKREKVSHHVIVCIAKHMQHQPQYSFLYSYSSSSSSSSLSFICTSMCDNTEQEQTANGHKHLFSFGSLYLETYSFILANK